MHFYQRFWSKRLNFITLVCDVIVTHKTLTPCSIYSRFILLSLSDSLQQNIGLNTNAKWGSLAKSGVNWGCHSSSSLWSYLSNKKENKVTLLAHEEGDGFVLLEITLKTSPDSQGRGWNPSTSACTKEGPFWHPSLASPLTSVSKNQRFKLDTAQSGICCSQPVDITMFSLPPALTSPKTPFLYPLPRRFFFKPPNVGLWLLFMGCLFGAAINCERFEVGSSNCNYCWVFCCFFPPREPFLPLFPAVTQCCAFV